MAKCLLDYFYSGVLRVGKFSENELCSAVEVLELKKVSVVEVQEFYRKFGNQGYSDEVSSVNSLRVGWERKYLLGSDKNFFLIFF